MAKRDSAYQSGKDAGPLAAAQVGRQIKVLPLLPYERELIEIAGCTEEEYRAFTEEARRRSLTRPAGYEHVPDVNNGFVVPILINLAIGIALTAVGALLAPKPGADDRNEITQRQLGSKKGRSRFNPTFGFDSVADIASYGDAVPVCFGFYEGPEYANSLERGFHGGIVVTPKLVWSRMLSYGTHQAIKAMYVIGEPDMGTPQVEGVWLGGNALNGIYSHQFAYYWSTAPGSGRIKGNHLVGGTRASASAADPWAGDDVYVCPTSQGLEDRGFCMAYTPTAATKFGVYNAIANGTDRRLNWRVISIPKDGESRSKDRLKQERKKISTTKMEGAGRSYARLMGLIEVDGRQSNTRDLVQVSVGSSGIFRIGGHKYDDPFEKGVDVADLRDEAKEERIRADQALQIGERFMIGNTMWRVVDRPDDIWRNGSNTDIRLECVNTLGDKTVGRIPANWLNKTVMNDGGASDVRDNTNHAQINFYPLLNADIAVIRNQRVTDVTEIGIRSQVWAQMNGLCNFKSIPSPGQLAEYDDDNVNISNGTMNLYFARYSYFALQVRPADDPRQEAWFDIGEEFCVKGSAPVDQFNYLQIKSAIPGQWEYRLVPLTAAFITRKPSGSLAWRLDAKVSTLKNHDYNTPYGSFLVTAPGKFINIEETETSNLMLSKGSEGKPPYYVNEIVPSALTLESWSPDIDGKSHAWRYEILGNPENYSNGHYQQTPVTMEQIGGIKKLRVFVSSTVIDLGGKNRWGQKKVWAPHDYRINQTHPDTTDHTWSDGQHAKYTVYARNPYFNGNITANHRVTVSSFPVWQPGEPAEEAIEFEHDTGIAEVSHYGDLIRRSCDSGAEHAIAYVNESVAYEDGQVADFAEMTTMGIVLRASRDFSQLDQPRAWVRRGIRVTRLLDDIYASSNNFADLVYWILTDARAGLGDYISHSLVDREEMRKTARFLANYKLFFDGAIEDRRNVRQLISELAPNFLCNFVVKNGKFSLVPALPCDDAGNANGYKVPISAIFSDGNIIEDTFQVTFLEAEERREIQSSLRYRTNRYMQLPEEHSVKVRWLNTGNVSPENSVDLTAYCTTREHAEMVGRYYLAIRRHVDHTVSFTTTPEGLSLGPGDYIKVFTQANPYSPSANGVIRSDGALLSATELSDGSYPVVLHRVGSETVENATIAVEGGRVADPTMANAIFTLERSSTEEHVYLVEQLTLNEDGLVEVSASYFPVDSSGVSLIARDTLDPSLFRSLP